MFYAAGLIVVWTNALVPDSHMSDTQTVILATAGLALFLPMLVQMPILMRRAHKVWKNDLFELRVHSMFTEYRLRELGEKKEADELQNIRRKYLDRM